MKSVTAVTLDTDTLRKMKDLCAQYRVSFSAYLTYALEIAPPIDEKLAQFLGNRKISTKPISFEEFVTRKPIFTIPQKGWHFHDVAPGVNASCSGVNCSRPKVPSMEYYEDPDGNIRDYKTNEIRWPALPSKEAGVDPV